jgi:aminoglycoside/choline kinase family phosphotransferase
MNDKNETKNLSIIHGLLRNAGITDAEEHNLEITTLAGDGSSRKFWRIMEGDKRLCLAVAPPSADAQDLAEANAARFIGLHLLQQGVRVPEQYGWNEEYGVLLFEDLGDKKLHDYVLKEQESEDWLAAVRSCYTRVVKELAVMQVRGAIGFDPDWCWDTPRYDKRLMLERESDYFLRAFWQDFSGKKEPSGLREEFVYLADRAALIPAVYFLHRDFQSRNIMLHHAEPCVIDFQGGRLGPLAYDLASLLIDPYVALPGDLKEELLGRYLDKLEELIVVDRRKFVEEYLLLALQRNLQIVGAFAFLTQQRKKVFFEQFLRPAVGSLDTLLDRELFSEMTILRQTVSSAVTYFG